MRSVVWPSMRPRLFALVCLAWGCAGPGSAAPRQAPPGVSTARADADARVTVDAAVPEAPVAEARVPGRLEVRSDTALQGLFEALSRAEQRRGDGRAAVVQLGDSHTEDGSFASRMRRRLQARFGDAGRGFVSPGQVHHYAQRDVIVGSDGGWAVERMVSAHPQFPLGIAGLRAHTELAGPSAWVGTCGGCAGAERASRFEVFYRARGGASLEWRLDDGPWRTVVRAPVPDGDDAAQQFHIVSTDDGAHRLAVRAGAQGGFDLFGAVMERDGPGVVVDSLGVVGARASHLYRCDWTVLSEQLAHRDPRLVVLQYGTNEAAERAPDFARIERELTEMVTRVRTAVPRASVLLLGPPDMARRAPPDADNVLPGQWQTPPALLEIVALQRRVARAADIAFFDSLTALGGPERIDAMTHQSPPEAWPDHVHLTPRGYARWSDLFTDDLLARYDAWSARRRP